MEEYKYSVYTTNKEIIKTNTINDIYLFNSDRFINLLYYEFKQILKDFNKKKESAYALCVDITGEIGQIGVCINTLVEYEKTAKYYQIKWDYDKEAIARLKYNSGDFSYRYFNCFKSEELNNIIRSYYCININHPIEDITQSIAFPNDFFERKIYGDCGYQEDIVKLSINALVKLESDFDSILKEDDFIFYVWSCGSSEPENINLRKKTNSAELLEKIFN